MECLKTTYEYLKHAYDPDSHFHTKGSVYKDGQLRLQWRFKTHDSKAQVLCLPSGRSFSWHSKKQCIVTLSCTEAEFISAGQAAKEAWLPLVHEVEV